MELDCHDVGILECFHHTVGGAGSDPASRRDILHCLMMESIDQQGVRAKQVKEYTTLLHSYHMRGVTVRKDSFHLRRKILVQASAERDVHQLLAAADGQDRLAGGQRRPGEQQVAAVADRIDAHRLVQYLLSEFGRIEVRAAGENNSVQFRKNTLSEGGIIYDGKYDRNASGLGDSIGIIGGKRGGAGGSASAADSDQRSGLLAAGTD